VFPIYLPPLRERKEDIVLLVDHFIKSFNLELKKNIKQVAPEARTLLTQYNYPGNIRELLNIVERAMILQQGSILEADTLAFCLPKNNNSRNQNYSEMIFQDAKSSFEKEYIKSLLEKHNNNISKASKMAGMDRKNFKDKMKKYDLYSNHHNDENGD
jgi:DNA-binding NtrC family response regulator